MIASLASRLFDFSSPILLDVDSSSAIRSHERRLTRTKTLDGKVAVADGGFVTADRTLPLALRNVAQADADALQALTERNGRVTISIDGRCYLALIQRLSLAAETKNLALAIVERLDAD